MSGLEVFGLIANIIAVTETCIAVYEAIEDLNDLPKAFKEVSSRLPLVQETLRAAKAHATPQNIQRGKEADALKKLLQGCEAKTRKLLEIFEKIESDPKKKNSIKEVYQKIALKLKSGRVETLMCDVLKDLQVMAAYAVFKDAVAGKVEALAKAEEDLAKVEPSLSDSDLEDTVGTAINHGRDQMNNFGSGTFNNVKGDYFKAKRDQNFGDIHGDVYFEYQSRTRLQAFYDLPPIDVPHFVKRPKVIEEIIANLNERPSDKTRPITSILYGIGGQGKTQIALNYCRTTSAIDRYRDMFWIDATSEHTIKRAFENIASILSGQTKLGYKYFTWNKVKLEVQTWDTEWLFVFDNYDDPKAFSIGDYMPQSNKGTVLITTRDATFTVAEAKRVEIPKMTKEEALELLLHGIDRSELSTDELETGKKLVNMLECLPLAVDQARWWFSQRRPDSYMEAFMSYKSNLIKTIPSDNWAYEHNNQAQNWYTTFEISLMPLFKANESDALHVLTLSAFFGGTIIWESFFEQYTSIDSEKFPWIDLVDESGKNWNTLKFQSIVADLGKRSLIRLRQGRKGPQTGAFFSLHPVIREWLQVRPPPSVERDYQWEVVVLMSTFVERYLHHPFPFQARLDILTHVNSLFSNPAVERRIYRECSNINPNKPIALLFASFCRRCCRLKDAESKLEKLLVVQRKLGINDSHPTSVDIRLELGETLADNSQYKEAGECMSKILHFSDKISLVQKCRALIVLAMSKGAQQNLQESLEISKKASKIASSLQGHDRLRLQNELLLANIEGARGRIGRAGLIVQDTYDFARMKLGPFDVVTLEASRMMSNHLASKEPPGEARAWLEKALANMEEYLGPEHRITLSTIVQLGNILRWSGQFEDARKQFLLAQSRSTTLFEGSPEALISEICASQQRYEEAKKHLDRARQMAGEIKDDVSRRFVLMDMIHFYLSQGKVASALPLIGEFFATFPFLLVLRTNKVLVVPITIFVLFVAITSINGYFLAFALVSIALIAASTQL